MIRMIIAFMVMTRLLVILFFQLFSMTRPTSCSNIDEVLNLSPLIIQMLLSFPDTWVERWSDFDRSEPIPNRSYKVQTIQHNKQTFKNVWTRFSFELWDCWIILYRSFFFYNGNDDIRWWSRNWFHSYRYHVTPWLFSTRTRHLWHRRENLTYSKVAFGLRKKCR